MDILLNHITLNFGLGTKIELIREKYLYMKKINGIISVSSLSRNIFTGHINWFKMHKIMNKYLPKHKTTF